MPLPGIPEFFSWFQSHGGYIDTSAFDIVTFPPSEGERGAIALKNIPVSPLILLSVLFLSQKKNTKANKLTGKARKATRFSRYRNRYFFLKEPAGYLINSVLMLGKPPSWMLGGLGLFCAWCGRLHLDLSRSGRSTLVRLNFFLAFSCLACIGTITAILPDKFNLPMFWDERDLAELKGTAVVGRFIQDSGNTRFLSNAITFLYRQNRQGTGWSRL